MDSSTPELLSEIHLLISLLIKQHVKSWYASLSQDDEIFLILERLTDHVHVMLSSRAQDVDWEFLILKHLPEMILRHIQDYNLATERQSSRETLEDAFLALQRHAGVANQQAYLCNVSDGLLTILLPYDDLISDVAYGFVRELLADLILRSVVDRLSEPWFWYELLLKASTRDTSKNLSSTWPNSLLTSLYTGVLTIRSFLPGVTSVACGLRRRWDIFRSSETPLDPDETLYYTAFPGIVEELLKQSDWPTTSHFLIMIGLPLFDFCVGKQILRCARSRLRVYLSGASLAQVVSIFRQILFSDDMPTPSRQIPSVEEQAALRAQLLDILPNGIHFPFMESKLINEVLLFRILDSLLGTIFPELRTRSPEQLRSKAVAIVEADREAGGEGGISTGRTYVSKDGPQAAPPVFGKGLLDGIPNSTSAYDSS